jgi:hypothetical protein
MNGQGIHPGNLKPEVNDHNYYASFWAFAVEYLRSPSFLIVAPCHRVIGVRRFDTIHWFNLEGSKYFRPLK